MVSNGDDITIDFTEFINYALFATPAPQNDKASKLFCSLLQLRLPSQTVNVDLGATTAISNRRLRGTSQLLESLQVLICKGIGTDGAEGSWRASAGGEELENISLACYRFLEWVCAELTELAALSSAIREACTTSPWIPTPHTWSLLPAAVHWMYVAALTSRPRPPSLLWLMECSL